MNYVEEKEWRGKIKLTAQAIKKVHHTYMFKPLHSNAQCKKWRTKRDEQNGFKLKNGPFAGWMFALQQIMSGPNADGRREGEIDEFC